MVRGLSVWESQTRLARGVGLGDPAQRVHRITSIEIAGVLRMDIIAIFLREAASLDKSLGIPLDGRLGRL